MLYNDRRDQKETDRRSDELRQEHKHPDDDFNWKSSIKDGRQYRPASNARQNRAGRDSYLLEQPDYTVRSKTSCSRVHETIHPHKSTRAILRNCSSSAVRLRRGGDTIQTNDRLLFIQQHAADQTEGAILRAKTARGRFLYQKRTEGRSQRSPPFHQCRHRSGLCPEVSLDACNLVLLIRSDHGADSKRQHLRCDVRYHTATTECASEKVSTIETSLRPLRLECCSWIHQ